MPRGDNSGYTDKEERKAAPNADGAGDPESPRVSAAEMASLA